VKAGDDGASERMFWDSIVRVARFTHTGVDALLALPITSYRRLMCATNRVMRADAPKVPA